MTRDEAVDRRSWQPALEHKLQKAPFGSRAGEDRRAIDAEAGIQALPSAVTAASRQDRVYLAEVKQVQPLRSLEQAIHGSLAVPRGEV